MISAIEALKATEKSKKDLIGMKWIEIEAAVEKASEECKFETDLDLDIRLDQDDVRHLINLGYTVNKQLVDGSWTISWENAAEFTEEEKEEAFT